MVKIQLMNSEKCAVVDRGDYDKVANIRWRLNDRGYVYGTRKKQILMHRLILGASIGQMVDHIDHDGLNNTRGNLRFCTYQQNGANRKPAGVSKYLGVCLGNKYSKKAKLWVAVIYKNGKRLHRKYFHREEDAARQYDEWATELHGEFANLNFKKNL